jgi:hypothetical protein|tara:strand:- start:28 stop:534 length:507 start_codon:yes stop_codon:yes gene_type:complete
MACAGIQGNENDSGAYQLTPIYRNPDQYLHKHHSGLFDGVFQSALHLQTSHAGVLPSNAPELRRANPALRSKLRRMNREQRYLRVPIEQTFGMIKRYTICGDTVYRGDGNQQAENFLLATQLAARLMRVRNAYPRGEKWMAGEYEDWERELDEKGLLFVDPLHPELYV